MPWLLSVEHGSRMCIWVSAVSHEGSICLQNCLSANRLRGTPVWCLAWWEPDNYAYLLRIPLRKLQTNLLLRVLMSFATASSTLFFQPLLHSAILLHKAIPLIASQLCAFARSKAVQRTSIAQNYVYCLCCCGAYYLSEDLWMVPP